MLKKIPNNKWVDIFKFVAILILLVLSDWQYRASLKKMCKAKSNPVECIKQLNHK